MTKLLVCIDGSAYADNICISAAWAATRMKAEIDLLHVLRRHSDYEAPAHDHTGSIGLGARSELLEELTKVDEERGRLDQQKGQIILAHSEKILNDAGVKTVNILHRRGSLVETIAELEENADIILMGKRGEHADVNSEFLGSNLEKVARAVHKPLLVVSSVVRPIKRFLIAYDGKASAQKAIDFIIENPLLKDLECHLLAVEHHAGDIDTTQTQERLRAAGFTVTAQTAQSHHADKVISEYVEENEIDLLVTGAYSHSRIRSMLLGSTTASLIKSCRIPLLLFK